MGDAQTASERNRLWLNYGPKVFSFHLFFIKMKIAVDSTQYWIHGWSIISAAKKYREERIDSSHILRLQYCCRTIAVRQRRTRRHRRKSSCCLNLTGFSACICIGAVRTHTHTNGQRTSESSKAKLCYRLEFHSPLFVFLFIPHISFRRIAMVQHSCGVWFHSAKVCYSSMYSDSLYLYAMPTRACVVEEVNGKKNKCFIPISRCRLSFAFARFRFGRSSLCRLCARMCAQRSR